MLMADMVSGRGNNIPAQTGQYLPVRAYNYDQHAQNYKKC